MSDAHFAKKAAQGGMAEVKLGQLALKNGSSATVKKFGQRMIDDHTKANDQLKDTAAKENVSLPSGLNAKDQARYDSLAKLSGAAFDKAYAQDMVKDHEMDIAEFKEESQNGKDGAIKNFAVQTLPTLEDHLKDAKRMLDTVNSASARTSASHSR
jgi:putative membrane protein